MNKQSLVMKIPDPWRKSESEQMHQRENMLSETYSVGVMLCDLQLAFVIQQAVKYMSRIAHEADDFGVKRAVLVRNMRVNLNVWLLTVPNLICNSCRHLQRKTGTLQARAHISTEHAATENFCRRVSGKEHQISGVQRGDGVNVVAFDNNALTRRKGGSTNPGCAFKDI